ncbi:hypothetical protein GCM10025789_10740 [Tessaracoccus lubricantis]|uniref:Uncharacterized protein n=1 Tax=Tessaracoccus lubricantis TaxID=545543 RepID=A0ABP9F8H9_9ACTN
MAALLTEYHLTDPDDMHPALALARYGKRRSGDQFVGFWLALLVESGQLRPNERTVRRHVEKFEHDAAVVAAIREAGVDDVDAELADAARVYFASGLEDASYTSTLMRMRRLSAPQVRAKAARQVADTAAMILDSGIDSRYVPLLVRGYRAALAPHGARELREAVADSPDLAAVITPILDA